jgi:hypothetical protein
VNLLVDEPDTVSSCELAKRDALSPNDEFNAGEFSSTPLARVDRYDMFVSDSRLFMSGARTVLLEVAAIFGS